MSEVEAAVEGRRVGVAASTVLGMMECLCWLRGGATSASVFSSSGEANGEAAQVGEGVGRRVEAL